MSEAYQGWMAKFAASTQHIIVNKVATRCEPVLASSAALQVLLLTVPPWHQHATEHQAQSLSCWLRLHGTPHDRPAAVLVLI